MVPAMLECPVSRGLGQVELEQRIDVEVGEGELDVAGIIAAQAHVPVEVEHGGLEGGASGEVEGVAVGDGVEGEGADLLPVGDEIVELARER